MDWLSLPPLNSLRAFSAVSDTSSYTLAAEQLNVTQAAVSQQVKVLEKHLGLGLVAKLGRGIELTGAGARLARELGIGFEIMDTAAACRTYNILVSEQRRVVAGIIQETD